MLFKASIGKKTTLKTSALSCVLIHVRFLRAYLCFFLLLLTIILGSVTLHLFNC